MTMIIHRPTTNLPSLALVLAASAAWVRSFAKRLAAAWRHRNDMAVLASLDDRTLADMGLTRADVRDAVAQPLWRDPTAVLARSPPRAQRARLSRDLHAIGPRAEFAAGHSRRGSAALSADQSAGAFHAVNCCPRPILPIGRDPERDPLSHPDAAPAGRTGGRLLVRPHVTANLKIAYDGPAAATVTADPPLVRRTAAAPPSQ